MTPVELESNWSPEWRRNDPSPAGARVGCQRGHWWRRGHATWTYIGALSCRITWDTPAAGWRSMKPKLRVGFAPTNKVILA